MAMTGTKAAWSTARRARQAEIIRRTRPWSYSTGPRTPAGKAISSKNAVMFRDDPRIRSAYLAIQAFLDSPFSLGASILWARVEAAICDGPIDDAARDFLPWDYFYSSDFLPD